MDLYITLFRGQIFGFVCLYGTTKYFTVPKTTEQT